MVNMHFIFSVFVTISIIPVESRISAWKLVIVVVVVVVIVPLGIRRLQRT